MEQIFYIIAVYFLIGTFIAVWFNRFNDPRGLATQVSIRSVVTTWPIFLCTFFAVIVLSKFGQYDEDDFDMNEGYEDDEDGE